MKTGNRIWALVLALALILGMGTTAFAQDSSPEMYYREYTLSLEELSQPRARSFSVESFGDQLSASAKAMYDRILQNLESPATNRMVLGVETSDPDSIMADMVSPAFHALLMDHPEKLYWVNKVQGVRIGTSGVVGGTSFTVTITFAVITSYQGTDQGDGVYTLSLGSLEEADRVARGIVASLPAGATPYEKLEIFNRWLYDNVQYDYDAASDSAPYGNASQMINAFVGNPKKVVCEGYSKAFKYLCDLVDIDCVLVTGTGNGGPHMWNCVKLDGQWYMVDTTFNTTGQNEKGFFCIGSKTLAALGKHVAEEISVTLAAEDYDPSAAPVVPATYKITVGALDGITVTGAPATAKEGDRITLNVAFKQDYEAPFTLSVNGEALPKGVATFTMPAKDVIITGSAVSSANIDAKIDPASVKLTVGGSSLLSAQVTMKDGSDYTGAYTWKSSDEAVAELSDSENGDPSRKLVIAKAEGTAIITVTVVGNRTVTASATVQVGDAVLDPEPDDPTPDPDPDPKPEPEPDPDPYPGTAGGSDDDDESPEHGWWDERDRQESRTFSGASGGKTDEKSVVAQTRSALQAAKAGQNPVVKLQGAISILRSTLQAAQKAADSKNLVFHFDTVKQKAVESRLYLRPSLLKGEAKDSLKLGVTINPAKLKKTFSDSYKNRLHLVSFSQKGGFGGPVEVALRLDLSGFDTKALTFYHYDTKTNTFSQLTGIKYYIDANGYLHIQNLTDLDTLIITNGAMVKK